MTGPILAASVSMFVVVDPLHLLWSRSGPTAEAPIDLGVPSFDATAANSR